MTTKRDKDRTRQVQGEGDRESARRFNEHAREFIDSGRVGDAAEHADEQDPEVGRRAERAGRRRAREVDPEVHRNYKKPTRSDRN